LGDGESAIGSWIDDPPDDPKELRLLIEFVSDEGTNLNGVERNAIERRPGKQTSVSGQQSVNIQFRSISEFKKLPILRSCQF